MGPSASYGNLVYVAYMGPFTSTVILYMSHIWAHPQYCNYVYVTYMGPSASTVSLYM